MCDSVFSFCLFFCICLSSLCGSVKTVVLKCLNAQNFLNIIDKDIVILAVAIILIYTLYTNIHF